MDEVLLRFPHLGEQIFQSLDFENLSNCTRVSKCWDNFIFENEKLRKFDVCKADVSKMKNEK